MHRGDRLVRARTRAASMGMVATGTNALLAYGRNITTNVKPLAASGELASSPTAAASQEMARTNSSSRPTAPRASRPARRAAGSRSAKATPKTSTVETRLRATLATTWPARHGRAADVHATGTGR